MSTKKPVKKTATKKTTAKKATAKKATSAVKAIKALTKVPTVKTKSANVRTQPGNPLLSETEIEQIISAFDTIREMLEAAARQLRPLDRKRLNGVGIKRQGFIERAFAHASVNTMFLPSYLPIEQFQESFEYFITLRALLDACDQLREFIRNMVVEAADITYTDAGEFYIAVKEAARRRIDGAETIYNDLAPFHKLGKRTTADGEPIQTQKQLLRDIKGISKGTKQGLIKIENIKPKLTGGKHEVIDETFKDTKSFKETEDGEFQE